MTRPDEAEAGGRPNLRSQLMSTNRAEGLIDGHTNDKSSFYSERQTVGMAGMFGC